MQTYFTCLSTWTVITKLSSKIIKRKHLTYVAMLHTSSCIYLLSTNHNNLAIANTLAYFTCDFMQIIFTNYYNNRNKLIFSIHHTISMITLLTIEPSSPKFPMMLNVFLDIELSNISLNLFYLTSKITKCKEVLAIANGVETVGYGYYRLGIIKHCYMELLKNDSLSDTILFGAMYSFGVFFTGALICTTFNRVANLF